jgi:hypothetical protein
MGDRDRQKRRGIKWAPLPTPPKITDVALNFEKTQSPGGSV